MSAAIDEYDEYGWGYVSDPVDEPPTLTGEQALSCALDMIEHPRTSQLVPGLEMVRELLDRPDVTVPGAALLDSVLACQRGISALQALQVRLTAGFARPGVAVPVGDVLDALSHRGDLGVGGPVDDDDRGDDVATRAAAGHSVIGDPQWDAAVALEAAELASAELGAALRVAPVTAGVRVEEALELVDQLPLTLQALEAGRIDRYRASVIASTLRSVDDLGLRARAERLIVERAVHGMTPGDLGRLAQKIVHDVDPAAAQRRAERAHARRGTGTRSLSDGLARFYADMSVEDAATAHRMLRALAAAVPDECREGRGESQLSSDIFADMWVQLCDTGVVDIRHAFTIPTEATAAADTEQSGAGAAPPDAEEASDAQEATDAGATADTSEPADAEEPVGEPVVDDLQVDEAGDDAPTAGGEPVDAGADAEADADADVPAADEPIVESPESAREAQDPQEWSPEGDHSMVEPQSAALQPTEYHRPIPDNDTGMSDGDATEGEPAIEVPLGAEPAGYDQPPGYDQPAVGPGPGPSPSPGPDPGPVARLLEALRATPVASVDANEQRRAGLLAAVRLPRGLRVNLDVTVALSTLAGFDDLGALLKGHGVIGAELARALTRAAGTVRLLVTGPVGTSHQSGASDARRDDCPQCRADQTVLRRDPSGPGAESCLHVDTEPRADIKTDADYSDLDHPDRDRTDSGRPPAEQAMNNGGLHRGGIDCGTVLDFGRTSYRVPAAAEDRVKTRDQRCRFLGCGQPAERCQNDHHIPWDAGGASCPCDLDTLCVRHHRAKTFAAWHATRHPDNTVTWTSPLGRRYLDQPAPDLPTENPAWAETSAWLITDDRQDIGRARDIGDRDTVINLRDMRAPGVVGRDAGTDDGDVDAPGVGRRDAGIATGDGHVARDIDPDDPPF